MAFRAEITIRTRIIAIWWKSSFRLWGPTALPPASATSVCRTGVPTRIYEIAPVSATGWRNGMAETRVGLQHLLQFGDLLKC